MNIRHAAILCLAFAAGGVFADTVAVSGGDVLSGRLVEIQQGAIVFESRLAGTTLLAIDDVSRLTTDGRFKCVMKDGSRLTGVIRYEDGGHTIQLDDGGAKRIELAEVTDAKPALELGVLSGPGIAGGAGAFRRSGSIDATGAYIRLDYQTGSEFSAGSLWMGDSGEDGSLESLRAWNTFTFDVDSRWEPEVLIDLERDALEGLEWRGGVFGGVRYDLFKGERHEVSTFGGVGASYTDAGYPDHWLDSPFRDRMWRHFYGDLDDEDGWAPEARATLKYSGAFGKRGRLFDRLTLSSDLDSGDFRGRYETGIAWYLSERWGLQLDMQVDYDSEPLLRRGDRWRTTVGAEIRLQF